MPCVWRGQLIKQGNETVHALRFTEAVHISSISIGPAPDLPDQILVLLHQLSSPSSGRPVKMLPLKLEILKSSSSAQVFDTNLPMDTFGRLLILRGSFDTISLALYGRAQPIRTEIATINAKSEPDMKEDMLNLPMKRPVSSLGVADAQEPPAKRRLYKMPKLELPNFDRIEALIKIHRLIAKESKNRSSANNVSPLEMEYITQLATLVPNLDLPAQVATLCTGDSAAQVNVTNPHSPTNSGHSDSYSSRIILDLFKESDQFHDKVRTFKILSQVSLTFYRLSIQRIERHFWKRSTLFQSCL